MICLSADCTFQCTVLFRLYDMDEDGFVSPEDLFTVLKTLKGLTLSDTHLQKLVLATIIQYDCDNDGLLSLSEFRTMVTSGDDC